MARPRIAATDVAPHSAIVMSSWRLRMSIAWRTPASPPAAVSPIALRVAKGYGVR